MGADGSGGRLNDRTRAGVTAAAPWLAAVAVVVVTVLTAGSIAGLVAYRRGALTPVASAPRLTTPSPVPTPSPLYLPGDAQVIAPSHDVVWVLVDSVALFRSTDHAATWERRSLPDGLAGRPLLSFTDVSDGWLLAPGSPETQCEVELADLWHTTDGAKTWVDVGARIDKTQCKDGIWFVDSTHGFVTASDPNHRPTVYRTADGGVHWSYSTVPDNPLFVTSPGGFSLHVHWIKQFGHTMYLLASGSQDDANWHDRAFVYTSADGGATWTWKQKLISAQMTMVTEQRWLQYTPGPGVLESVNGGQQFHPYGTDFSPLSPVLGGTVMVFADASVGYATGRGELERTLDRGAHWTVIPTPGIAAPPSPSPSPISMPADVQVSAPSAYTIFALVNSNSLFRSTDKGKTWVQKTMPAGGPAATPVISFVDDYHGYVLFPGQPGTQCQQAGASLYATSDSANTWDLVSIVKSDNQAPQGLPFEQCKDYMYFLAPSWGFIAGHDTAHSPVISRTENGGRTWDQSALPDPPGFTTNGGGVSLHVTQIKNFVSRMLLEAATDAGGENRSFIYESSDGGATWSYLEAARGDEVFVTTTRWLRLAGDVHEETTDGGQTWHPFVTQNANPGGGQSKFVFADASTGYGVAGGQVERTADGGATWSLVKSSWP